METSLSRLAPVTSSALISQKLAEFAAGLCFEDIPAQVRERAKYLLLDAIGVAFLSTKHEFARSTLAGFAAFGTGSSTVIGMNTRLALRDAVIMNGVLVHGLDYDDSHIEGIIHPSSSCFPCAFGVASELGASGRELLTAYVLGIEIEARLGMAAKGGLLHEAGFHPAGMVAAYASALIAGRLHRLETQHLVMAQGIALSTMASSSRQYGLEGAWTKRLHPGWNAAAGITAAVLAKHGFIGPRETYEGQYGFYAVHLGALTSKCDLGLVTAGLGQKWETLGVAVKPIPACHLVHACSDAAVIIARKHGVRPADVASIRALVTPHAQRIVCEPVAMRRRPANSYAAKFSIQYAVACSLARGRFGSRELEPDVLNDPEILALADKVEYELDPKSGNPRHFSGEVIVKTVAGREYSHREDINRGAPDRPLSADDIVAKFMDNATCAVSVARAEQIRDAILAIDSAEQVSQLDAVLAC